MKFFTKKRSVIALVAFVVAALAAVGAYAYFTSTGSGSGNATVGSSSNIVITNDTVGTLYPGGADVTVPVHLQNPGGGNEYVGTVSGTVADNGGCLGSWFVVDPVTYNAEVNHGATNGTSTKVRMLDAATSQDACQGATLTVNWSSN
jgi:hypothetical protein